MSNRLTRSGKVAFAGYEEPWYLSAANRAQLDAARIKAIAKKRARVAARAELIARRAA